MILIRKYYWRKIEFVDNEKEDRRNTLTRNRPSKLLLAGGKMEGGGPNFHASLHDDRVMKIAGSTGDYSNETSNKIPANQPP